MKIYTLNSGLRVVHIPYNNPHVSYCSLIINTGTVNELPGERGMAHFMEHMLFKGTQMRSGLRVISEIDNLGGELNAFTTKEKTCIHASLGTPYLAKAIDLIADITLHSAFPLKEINKEKQIVHDEINMYLDNPEESIYDDFMAAMFPNHPLGRTILGGHDDIDRMTREGLQKFISNHYRPDQMIFTVFTATDPDKVVKWVSEAFEFRSGKKLKPEKPQPTRYRKFQKEKKSDFIQAHCIMGAPVCNVKSEDRFAVALLNNILGGPFMNSRLNLAIREKFGFCYSIYSDVQFFRNSGVLTINYATEKKYIQKTTELVRKELEKLTEKGISPAQLKIALKQVSGQIDLSWDNASGLVTSLGNALLDTGRILNRQEIFECYRSIGTADLRKVAEKYFDPKRQSIYSYIPEND